MARGSSVTAVWRAGDEDRFDDAVRARANASSVPPVSTTRSKQRLLPRSGWITGVAGSSAVSASVTAGNSAQSTVTRCAASSACARVSRDDRDHRLALPARALERERILRRGAHALEMREHADVRLAEPRHVPAGENARPRPGCVRAAAASMRDDPRVGMRTAHEGNVRTGAAAGCRPRSGRAPRAGASRSRAAAACRYSRSDRRCQELALPCETGIQADSVFGDSETVGS